jgi:DNA-binding NarL/FixJ family response regulator
MRKTRVILADDHQILLEGLQNLLEPEFEVVGKAENGKALVEDAKSLHPDVIVADISMPLLNGLEAAHQIGKIDPKIKIIFLTMHPDVSYAIKAFDVGASGYVLKRSASRELVTAINEVMSGRTYVTPMIAGELMQGYRNAHSEEYSLEHKLTDRQREILQLLAEGHSAKKIADMLSISPRTVETHKYNMMQALDLKTTADLVKFSIKQGIVSI